MLDLSLFEAFFFFQKRFQFHRFSANYVDLNSHMREAFFFSVNVMISCYVLALTVLNMRVKFHSCGLPQSLSLETEIRISLLLPANRATFEAIFTLMSRRIEKIKLDMHISSVT